MVAVAVAKQAEWAAPVEWVALVRQQEVPEEMALQAKVERAVVASSAMRKAALEHSRHAQRPLRYRASVVNAGADGLRGVKVAGMNAART